MKVGSLLFTFLLIGGGILARSPSNEKLNKKIWKLKRRANRSEIAILANDLDISSNQQMISANKLDITANELKISQIAPNVSTNELEIASNTQMLMQIAPNVTANKQDISQMTLNVSANQQTLSQVSRNVSANEDEIFSLKTNITLTENLARDNSLGVSENSLDIVGVAQNVSNTELEITALKGQISSLEANLTSAIDTVQAWALGNYQGIYLNNLNILESTYNISQVRDEISNLTRDSADLRDSIDKLAPQLPSLLIYGGDDGTYSNLTTNLINLYTGENNTALGRPNYVQKIEGGLIKGVPVYCGGEDDNITPSDKCFQVGDPINPLATLSVPRTEHSSVVINNDVLFLIGGTTAQYASTPTDTTEFYSNDLGVYSGPKLPIFEFRRGCAALIDVNHVIIIGGLINYFYGSKETWILNLSTSTWTKGPDLDTGRDGHACASVNGVVMVTGGQSLAVTYSELLMTADPTVWATSTYIPYQIYGHVLIPNMHKTGFYMIGGLKISVGISSSNEIREVSCDTLGCDGSFRLIGYFNTPRMEFLAMLVPDSMTLTSGTMSTRTFSVGNVTTPNTGRTERMDKLGRQEMHGRLEKPEKTA